MARNSHNGGAVFAHPPIAHTIKGAMGLLRMSRRADSSSWSSHRFYIMRYLTVTTAVLMSKGVPWQQLKQLLVLMAVVVEVN